MFFWPLALLVLLAPLYKGGNRAGPLLLLELAAVGLLLALALRHRDAFARDLPGAFVAALAIMLVYPLVQLVPLPASLWRVLPGQADYADVLRRFGAPGAIDAARALSVSPAATERGWLALLPPLACLFAVRALGPRDVVRLLVAMVAFAGLEGLLGLLQVGAGGYAVLRIRDTQDGVASGTFVNRAHLSMLLAMSLPVLVGLLAYGARRERHANSRDNAISRRVLLFGSGVLILLCLVFTFSRGGIASALLGLAASSLLLVEKRVGSRRALVIVGALIGVGIALAALVGLAPVLERFEPASLRLSGGGRLALSAATLRAALDFLPFGSGLSTFADVFPRYQGSVFGGFIDYAHNDYAQLLLELGLAGAVIALLLLWTYLLRMRDLVRRQGVRSFTVLQVAAGIGMLPALVHSAFDFGLHMPGNAVWFATLAGVLLHPGVRDRRDVAGAASRGAGALEEAS
jgi:O-antigen ligase